MSLKDQCELAGICSGCEWIEKSYDWQINAKVESFNQAWLNAGLDSSLIKDLSIVSISPTGLRDRVDLIMRPEKDGMRLGLYDFNRTEIVNISTCPQMSPALSEWFAEFRKTLPQIKIGSARLRVSPSGKRGVWLDLPNIEVKNLLDEGTWLRKLLSQATVEIGQKRKRLVEREGKLKLDEPVPDAWFETYIGKNEKPVSLYTTIGGFTQPGFRANKALIHEVRIAVEKAGGKNWVELCSGSGNFTLPLASLVDKVSALEIDEQAVENIVRSAQESGLSQKIEAKKVNVYRMSPESAQALSGVDGMLADPPRSGLKEFLDVFEQLIRPQKPEHFIYVSCFQDTFAADARRILGAGYKLTTLVGVDQFPQSPHCEFVGSFKKA